MAVDVVSSLEFRENQLHRLRAVLAMVPSSTSSSEILSQINNKLEKINFEKIISFSDLPVVFDLIINQFIAAQEERDSSVRKLRVAKKKVSDLESRGIFVSEENSSRTSPEFVASVIDTSSEEMDSLRKRIEELEAEKSQSEMLLQKAVNEAEKIQGELEAEFARNNREKQQLTAESAKYNRQVHEKERELESVKLELRNLQNQQTKLGLPGITSTRQPVITNLLSGESSPEDIASAAGGSSVTSSPSVSSVASLRAVHEIAFSELQMVGAQREIEELQVSLRSAERELNLAKSRLSDAAATESQLARVNRDLIEKETKLLSLERQLQVRDAELTSLRARVSANESTQAKEMADQLRENMGTIHMLQSGLDEMNSRAAQDERKNRSELNEILTAKKRLESELLEVRLSLEETRATSERKSAEICDLKSDMDTLLSKLQKQSDRVADLELQITKASSVGSDFASLSEQLRAESSRCRQLERLAEESSDSVRRLELKLAETRTVSDNRIAELESVLGRIREESLSSSVAVSRLETELAIERSKSVSLSKELEATTILVKEKTALANRAAEQLNQVRREKLDLETDLEATKLDARILQSSSDMSSLLESLRSDIAERNSRISLISTELDNTRTELSESRKSLMMVRHELDAKQGEVSELRSRCHTIEKARDMFSVEVLKKSEQVNKLQSELASLRTENEMIGSAMAVSGAEESRAQLASLEEDFAIAKFEKQSLEDELSQVNGEMERLRRILGESEQRVLIESEKVEFQKNILRELLSKLVGSSGSLPKTVEGVCSAISTHVEFLDSQLMERAKRISELESQLDSVSSSALSTSVSVKSQLATLMDGMNNLRDESLMKDKEICDLRVAMDDLKTRHMQELSVVESQLLSVRGLLTQTETENLVAQEKRLSELRDSHRSQIETIQANAQLNMAKIEKMNSELQGKIDELEKQIVTQSLASDLIKREGLDEVRRIRSELDVAKGRIKELEKQIMDEQTGIEAMRKLAGSSIGHNGELEKEISNRSETIKQLEESIVVMKNEHEREVADLMKELVSTAESMESVVREIYDQKISAIEAIRGEEILNRPSSPIQTARNGDVREYMSRLRLEIVAARDDFSGAVDREVLIRKFEQSHAEDVAAARAETDRKIADKSAIISDREATITGLKKSAEDVQLVLAQKENDLSTLRNLVDTLQCDLIKSRDENKLLNSRLDESKPLVTQLEKSGSDLVSLRAELESSMRTIAALESSIALSESTHRQDIALITEELVETAESMSTMLQEMNELKVSAIESVREVENNPSNFAINRAVLNESAIAIDTSDIRTLRESLRRMKAEVMKQRDDFSNVVDRESLAAKLNTVHQHELLVLGKDYEEKLAEISQTLKAKESIISELKQTLADHNLIINQKTVDVEELKIVIANLQVKAASFEADRTKLVEDKKQLDDRVIELTNQVDTAKMESLRLHSQIDLLNTQIEETESAHEVALSSLGQELVLMADSMETIMREIYEQKLSAIETIRGGTGTSTVAPVVAVSSPRKRPPTKVSSKDIDDLRATLSRMKSEIMEQRSDLESTINHELVIANLRESHKLELELFEKEFVSKIYSLNDMIRERDSQLSILRQSLQNSSDDVKLDLSQRDLEIVSLNKSIAELKLQHREQLELLETQTEQLRNQIVETETGALARTEKRIGDLHDSYKKQIFAAKKSFEDERNMLRTEISRLVAVGADYELKIESIRSDLAERETQITALKSTIEELENTQMVERILLATNSTAELNAMENSRSELAAEYEQRKRNMEIKFRKEMDELCAIHAADRDEFEKVLKEFEELIEARNTTMVNLQAIIDEREKVLNEKEKQIENMISVQNEERQSWEKKLLEIGEKANLHEASVRTEYEKKLLDLSEVHSRELAIVRTELEESRIVFDAQLKQLEDRIVESEHDTEKILSLHEQEIDALISPRETQKIFLESEIARLETVIDDAKNLHASEVAGKDAEIDELNRIVHVLEKEIAAVNEAHETELDVFESQVRSSVELLNQSVDAVNEQHDIVIESIRDSFGRQLNDLRAENAETIDLLESELERRADEIESLKKRIEQTVNNAQVSRTGYEMEITGLNELLIQMKENHSVQLGELEAQISQMRELLSETEIATAARFEQRLKDIQESHQRQLDTVRNTAKEESAVRDSEVRRLENELELKQNLSIDLSNKYENFSQQKQEEFEVLMKKIARKDGEILAQSEQLDKLYAEISDIRKKNAEYVSILESNIAELDVKLKDSLLLAQQHEEIRVSELTNDFEARLSVLRTEFETSENQNQKLIVQLDEKEKQICLLEEKKMSLESAISVMENSAKENNAEMSRLVACNSELSQNVQKLSTEMIEAKKLARDSLAKFEDQCEEVAALKQELGDTEEELDALKSKYDDQFSELIRLQEVDLLAKQQINHLEGACETAKKLSQEAQSELALCLVDLKSSRNEIGILKSRISQLQTQVHDQQLEIELMDAEVSMKAADALKRQVSATPSPGGSLQVSSSRTFGTENFSPSSRRPPTRVPTLGLPIPARQRSGSMNSSIVSSAPSLPDNRDADIEALQGYAAARDKKIKSLMKSEELLRAEVSMLTSQIAENQQIVREASVLQSRVEFLTRELEKMASNGSGQVIDLESYLESTKRLEEQLVLAKMDIERLKSSNTSVHALNVEIERLQRSETKLLARVEKLKSQVSEIDLLKEKIISLEEQIASASIEEEPEYTSEKKIRELNKELTSQGIEIDRLLQRINSLQQGVEGAERERLLAVREKLDLEIAFRELSVKYEEQVERLETELKESKKCADDFRRTLEEAERRIGSRPTEKVKVEEVVGLHDLVNTLETRIRTPTPGLAEYFDPHSPSVVDPEDTGITLDTVESLVNQLSLARGELEEIRRVASYMDASSHVSSPKSSTTTVAKDHARIAMISDSVVRFMDRISMIEKAVETLKQEHQKGFVSLDEAMQLQQRVSSLQAALDREGDKRKAVKATIKELCDKTTDLCNKYSFGQQQ